MIKAKTSYETPDGLIFDTHEDAIDHAYESSIQEACNLASKINMLLFDPKEDEKARHINYQKIKSFLLHEAREDLFDIVDFMRCYPEDYKQPAKKETT